MQISVKNCAPQKLRPLQSSKYYDIQLKAAVPHRTDLNECQSIDEKTEKILDIIDVVQRPDADFSKLGPLEITQLKIALQKDLDYLANEVNLRFLGFCRGKI
ncbi:hypothetical protein L596_021094 [Steinernema carpocapsae]|uniref:Uncharacterized protein n=1 Tax=Steinernema carpocapsae TaxID=34508 RepID=A0A4U5MVP6_STECR|nr:hypothetical protein L596_021094 [Steinernema carpocapsae]